MSTEWIGRLPPGFWAAAVLLWFVASVAWRLHRGRPLIARRLPGAVFAERWASARFGTGLVARLGTAKNCLHVQVTDTALVIHPHFPFTLGFMPEVYNLDHRIPLAGIRAATIVHDGRLKTVEVLYADGPRGTGVVQVLLRDAASFVQHCSAAQRTG